MRKFCYKCGKITEELYNGLCKECAKNISGVEKPIVEIFICSECGKIKEGKLWKQTSMEAFVRRKLRAKKIDMEKYTALMQDERTIEFEVKTKYMLCDTCVKILSGYHASVLQLRGFSESEIVKILSCTENLGKDFFIEETKHGINVKFIEKPAAEKVARKIKRMFKRVKIIKSCKLITVKDGKRVYRNFISVRKLEEKE